MEKEQVVSEVVEVTEVEQVEVSPEVTAFEKQVEAFGEQVERNQQSIDKAKQLSEEILAERQEYLKELEQELLNKEKNLILKDSGLEAFADIIKVDNIEDLTDVVVKLNKIVNDIKIANSYQPKDNAQQDAMSVHIKNKDTKSMIGSKLANLFK